MIHPPSSHKRGTRSSHRSASVVPRASLLLLLLISATPPLISAQTDPFGGSLEENTCYSTTSLYKSSSLTVQAQPDRRLVLYTFPGTSAQVELQCLNLLESSPALASTNTLCDLDSLLWLCKAPEGTDTFSCTSLVAYISTPKQTTKHGDPYDGNFHWQVEWDPLTKSEFCYPREIFLTMIGTNELSNGGNVATIVVFTVIVVLVVGLVALFGGQQLKRHLTQQLKDDQPAVRQDLPPAMPMQEAMYEMEEVYAQSKADREYYEGGGDGTRGLGLEGDDFDDYDLSVADPTATRDTFAPHGRVELPPKASLYHQSVGAALDPIGHKSRALYAPDEGTFSANSLAEGNTSALVMLGGGGDGRSPMRSPGGGEALGSTGRAHPVPYLRADEFSVIPRDVFEELKDPASCEQPEQQGEYFSPHSGNSHLQQLPRNSSNRVLSGSGFGLTHLRPLVRGGTGGTSSLLSSMQSPPPPTQHSSGLPPTPRNTIVPSSSHLNSSSSSPTRTVIPGSMHGGGSRITSGSGGAANKGSVLGNSPLSCNNTSGTPRRSVQFKARH